VKLNSRVLAHNTVSLSFGVLCPLFTAGIGKIRRYVELRERIREELERRAEE